MGLAICLRLVRAMGGKMWVESAVGQGTHFHFTVKLEPARTAIQQKALPEARTLGDASSSSAPAEGVVSPQSVRVLVAEDNVLNQRLTVRLLEKRGYQVSVVSNGREALAKLENNRYDLVLMDLEMPEIDGLVATAAIRERERTTGGHQTVIALTAHAIQGEAERCLAAGMDGYLAKPVRPQDLYEFLDQHARNCRTGS